VGREDDFFLTQEYRWNQSGDFVTEAEWLTCKSPGEMLTSICDNFGAARRKSGRRKLRLFACACCRHVWHKLTEDRDRQIVLLSEDFADGKVSPVDLAGARKHCLDRPGYIYPAIRAAIATTNPQPRTAANEVMFGVCSAIASHGAGYHERWHAEVEALAEVVREVFGNPFHPIRSERCWRTANDGAVVRLAQSIYDTRNFVELPILLDALEDAGCNDAAILGHLRGPGAHVRGCWAVDLLTGRV
jgi:hypothetical protein